MRFLLFVGLVGLSACAFEGGANLNQQMPGNESGGVDVATGDIGIAATGDYIVISASPGLRILRPGWLRPERSTLKKSIGVPVTGAKRLAFSPTREVFYVATLDSLLAIDAVSAATLWTTPLPAVDPLLLATGKPRLEVSSDDSTLFYSAGRTFAIFDARSGSARTSILANDAIIDFDVLPDGSRVVVTPAHHWNNPHTPNVAPETILSVVDVEKGTAQNISVPNCSSPLSVSPDGSRAFLAPTGCTKDPVSVVDLDGGKWIRNLPGFGPVGIAPEGTIVAFMDAFAADKALFDHPEQIPDPKGVRYYLMVIDPDSLEFRTTALGDVLPRFAMTPDGNVLLVDTTFWARDVVTLVDTKTLEHRAVDGPAMYLSNFVMTPDSRWAYALDQDMLYALDVAGAKATHLATADNGYKPPSNSGSRGWSRTSGPAFAPRNINISPDGKTLYLRPRSGPVGSAGMLCVYPIAEHACTEWLSLD
jgi:hypothetical protein